MTPVMTRTAPAGQASVAQGNSVAAVPATTLQECQAQLNDAQATIASLGLHATALQGQLNVATETVARLRGQLAQMQPVYTGASAPGAVVTSWTALVIGGGLLAGGMYLLTRPR